MIKGCQKKIIIIEGGESSPFETAFFVLRKNTGDCCAGGDDILREADRIISESIPDVCLKRRKRERLIKMLVPGAFLLIGLLLGGSGCALLILFL